MGFLDHLLHHDWNTSDDQLPPGVGCAFVIIVIAIFPLAGLISRCTEMNMEDSLVWAMGIVMGLPFVIAICMWLIGLCYKYKTAKLKAARKAVIRRT